LELFATEADLLSGIIAVGIIMPQILGQNFSAILRIVASYNTKTHFSQNTFKNPGQNTPNNGLEAPAVTDPAHPRLVMYWKGLEDKVLIRPPADLGGLKSPEYLAINPQGKMPALSPSRSCLPPIRAQEKLVRASRMARVLRRARCLWAAYNSNHFSR
jgi:hypothetical protein